jgi:hypothetical protein
MGGTLKEKEHNERVIDTVLWGVVSPATLLIFVLFTFGAGALIYWFWPDISFDKVVSTVAFALTIVGGATVLFGQFSGLQRDSRDYAHNISRRDAATSEEAQPQPVDTSNPEALFKISRQRLLDEAVRIDRISRRNLGIGILFSSIALAVLAWPLVSAVFFPLPTSLSADANAWGVLRTYLPRFSVGLLLQFVGFFFLRLYVANEVDLKHNKNEITNLEMKMMALQLAKEFDDAASKKEIMKSLAQTERNYILKKNERSVTTEALSEYNDLRGLIEKLVSKIPGTK